MSISKPSDADADDVSLALDGDREAFGRLYDRHARVVRTVVVAVSGDFDAVEDLTQETFLRGYRRLASLQNVDGFGHWIKGIARWVAKERRRELGRDRHRYGTDDYQRPPTNVEHDVVERDEEQCRVLAAVADLPERERLAVNAYYFHEGNADEAAAIIGLSRSGFYGALERALDRLRKRLGVKSPSNASRK